MKTEPLIWCLALLLLVLAHSMSPLNALMSILALREAASGQADAAARAMAPYKRGGPTRSPQGGLGALAPRQAPVQPPSAVRGADRLVQGPGGGQDDVVPAALAPGEYVWDADTVSAFGDGDGREGARRLDAVRQAIRAHKRSAPANKIPPKAKSFGAYMKGVA